jgi:alcohol dehydrogenase, propanol-preferring
LLVTDVAVRLRGHADANLPLARLGAFRNELHVGVAGGTAQWSFFKNPYEATLTNSYWGTIQDLHEVVELYRAGSITPDVERFTMDNALEAYRRLRDGELDAHTVVVPHS